MKTRTGKISQLPKPIRDELNHRLQNGKQGPELLAWLNELSEVKELITTKFDHHPINRQNLTEWRQGGYEDWLQHQQREWRIQRLTEEGSDLAQRECKQDAFEHSARFALAELMADFDGLHQLQDHDRFQRLCALTRQLTRLQDSFNRSRWSALAWTRWNERFFGPANYDHKLRPAEKDAPPPQRPAPPAPTPISDSRSPNSQLPSPIPDLRTEIKPIQTNSTGGGAPAPEEKTDARPWMIRNPSHHQGCGCVCKQCHSDDSRYPYQEALADHHESKRLGTFKIWRGQTVVYIRPVTCNCPCPEHAPSAPPPNGVRPSPAAATLPTQPAANVPPLTLESRCARDGRTPAESTSLVAPPSPPPHTSSSGSISPTNPLPYDSVTASLRRISLLASRRHRTV